MADTSDYKGMTFGQRIINAQNEIKAPKGQFNSFGKYRYRSAEDILEAVKPVLLKYGLYLTVSDEIVPVGDRVYIKAVATIHDTKSDKTESVQAFAREPIQKKGQDDSQITGATSSYARKYAMNGLFCLDDNKDADTDEFHRQEQKPFRQPEQKSVQAQDVKPSRVQLDSLYELAKQKGFTQAQVWKAGRVQSEDQMTMRHYMAVFQRLQKLPDVKQGNLNL